MAKDDDNLRDDWLKKLSDEDKAHSPWRKRAKEADKAYCDYREDAKAPLAPLFPSTIAIIHGKIYARPPKPDIRKRHSSGSYGQASAAVPPQAAPPVGAGQAPVQPGGLLPNQAGAPPQGAPAPGAPGMPGGIPPQQPGAAPNPAIGQAGTPMPGLPGGVAQTVSMAPPPVADPIADDNTIAICLEDCLKYVIDSTLFDDDGHLAVNDFLVAGLGVAKVEMETRTEPQPLIVMGNEVKGEDGKTVMQNVITYQNLRLRHFSYSQFRWEPAKDWRRVGWVAFDHYLTKDDIEDMFDVDLDDKSGSKDASGNPNMREDGPATGVNPPAMDKYEGVYVVHEIWDKDTEQRIFVTDAYDDVLAQEDDPLELDDFFPCPRPMMTLQNGRELVPCPDYWQSQALFDQADQISERIYQITKQVKDIGFYDDSFSELQKITLYDDGTLLPVKNLLDKLRSIGGKANADMVLYQVDMTAKVAVLGELMQQYEGIKARIEQIWGIADIQQGVSNPGDTATAQNIKNEWADIRTGQRVQKVALFFRDVFRIMAELLANKFDLAQIQAMCGIQLSPDQVQTMRSDLARAYVIDVQSDSTMIENDAQDVNDLTAFMGAFTPWLKEMLPAVKQGILPADLAKEITALFIDTYKPGRNLQQAVEALPNTVQQLNDLTGQLQSAQQQAQQAQQQLQQIDQAKEARENARAQADIGLKNADTAIRSVDAQRKQSELPTSVAKANAENVTAAAHASQASRADIIEGIQTGIQ